MRRPRSAPGPSVLVRGRLCPARRGAPAVALLGLSLVAAAAVADWLQPDVTVREAQLRLQYALRDTSGHADDPARLDTLGAALLKLGRFVEAEASFRRVLAVEPENRIAAAGLGKMALFAGQLAEAESLLEVGYGLVEISGGMLPAAKIASFEAGSAGAYADLYAALLQRRDFAAAAKLATSAHDPGRVPLLKAMAERGGYRIAAPEEARIPWTRAYPVPLVRVKLNGQSVLLALDTGARDLILDEWAAHRARVETFPTQSEIFWTGTRVAVRPAWVQRLELGGVRIEGLPAGVTKLRKWSILVNPQAEPVAGVIGLDLLSRFTPTLDYAARVLELRRRERAYTPRPGARRVPFEIWGESELTVYGSIAGGRRLAMVVHSGLPECGIAAPAEVFEEAGIKAGLVARAARGVGSLLQGRPWTRVTVSTVSVGPVVTGQVPGWAGALDAAELWRHGVRRDALLSNDFFAKRRVTIDWDARELVFEGR
ncbi:MAG TPA: aspartyl protease family protein [Candidatus Eisenbacteria bacterium]|jgi:hypothetical protein